MPAVEALLSETPPVPLPRIAGFVRQVTHDVRNTLNSLDLQAAYLLEVVTDPEALDELRRMRSLIHTSARQLQGLSANFWTSTPQLVTYSTAILVEDLQDRLHRTHPEQLVRLDWNVHLGEEAVSVDIEMLFGALTKLLENAWTFASAESRIQVDVHVANGSFLVELRHSVPVLASDPSHWGFEPFVTSRRGAYGLGVFRARTALAAQSGELTFSHDSGSNLLLTRVSLPIAPPDEFAAAPPHSRH